MVRFSAQAMPPEIKQTFGELSNCLIRAHERWEDFCAIYNPDDADPKHVARTRSYVDLLNSLAPDFFALALESFRDDTVLSLCRLTDPDKSCGRDDNLSLRRLVELIKACGNTPLSDAATAKWQETSQKAQLLRAHRHKRLAHNDLNVVIGNHSLSQLEVGQVNAVFDAAEELMNLVSGGFGGDEFFFQAVGPRGGLKELCHTLLVLLPKGKWSPPSYTT